MSESRCSAADDISGTAQCQKVGALLCLLGGLALWSCYDLKESLT